MQIEQLEEQTRSVESGDHGFAQGRVAILVESPTTRRLLEGLLLQLELTALPLRGEIPEAEELAKCELVVADETSADLVRQLMQGRERFEDVVNPAIIAVRQRGVPKAVRTDEPEQPHGFAAMLTLPQDPALILAQLSVTLYAYRSFVRRYRSAMDELNLNRRIFRSVTSGISIADATAPDLPLVYVNPAFELMTGYSLEEVQGKNCRFLQREDRDQPALTLIREALAEKREVVAILKNYRKDGSFFWNELSMSPIRNRDGKVTHIVGIQMDVTARVEFEAALRESEKLAAVGRLAASIAHEINNPLESLTNLIFLARAAEDPMVVKQYLTQADAELVRASHITSQSLRFYRQSTKPMAVRPSEILEGVVHLYEAKLINANIDVEMRERSTESVVCLESEIRQVLTNLVRNSIDAMAGSRGRLLLRTRHSTNWATGAQGTMITIADTGTGISEKVQKNLYKAFFSTKGIGGTGLGLWVSAEIVKRHHGSLRVRSSAVPKRSWTVFQLFLPHQGVSG